jgi:hypothetical protein
MKRYLILLVSMTLFGALSAPSFTHGEWKTPARERSIRLLEEAEKEAVRWLQCQMVPNSTVPDPALDRRRLLLSYIIPPEDPAYPYIYGRSFIYDDAVGVVAFTMAGKYREAEYLLSAMRRVIRDDGSFWFVYNTHNSWPTEGDHEGSLVRTGAVAWAGYAAAFYLRARHSGDPSFLDEDPFAGNYLDMARSIASYILRHQIRDENDVRHGLVTGGDGTYTLHIPEASGEPVEEYDGSSLAWVSTEHNIDSYFFLMDLGLLTGNQEYSDAACMIKEGLFRTWSEENGQFYRGIKKDGDIDKALPLDCASWGALFLISTGNEGMARRCLETVQRHFFSEYSGLTGYKPYYSGPLYDDEQVNSFYAKEIGSKSWEDANLVWGEGSFGVSAAYCKAGNPESSLQVLEGLLPAQTNGGFRYSTAELPYQFNSYPSVASTAWFIIAVETLLDAEKGSLFWGG